MLALAYGQAMATSTVSLINTPPKKHVVPFYHKLGQTKTASPKAGSQP
jgi:hypothetical protein